MAELKKNIFITGVTGISGGWAIDELCQRNWPVRALVRTSDSNKIHKQLEYVQGDLNSTSTLEELARDNSGIIHYACASMRGNIDIQIDIDAMKTLLKTWEHGPFVYISTMDVYGLPTTPNIDEGFPVTGVMNAYAAGKVECEKVLFAEAARRGRNDFTIFRAPWIFAPSIRTKQHIQRRFLKCFDQDSTIRLPGETQEEWAKYCDPYVDARDLAWLVAEAITKPLGGAGNVVAETFRWHDFFELLLKLTNDTRPIEHRPKPELSQYVVDLFSQIGIFNGDKVNRHFGFKPRFQLRDTLTTAFNTL